MSRISETRKSLEEQLAMLNCAYDNLNTCFTSSPQVREAMRLINEIRIKNLELQKLCIGRYVGADNR